MQLVIDIPEDLYKGIEGQDGSLETEYICDKLMKAIDNGTPLPKGHGKLKDENEIFECIRNRVKNLMNDRQFRKYRKDIDLLGTIPHIRNEVKTIIGADRG